MALAATAALLAACGSSGSGASSESSGSSAGSGSGEPIELSFATAVSEKQANDWAWVAAEVGRRTDGRVKFRNFYNGTLVGAAETLQAVKDGRADMGWVTPTYQPADFPVWYVSQLQYLSDNPQAVARALHDEYEDGGILAEDFTNSGVVPVGFLVYGPNTVGTSKPIQSVSDLEGRLIRSGGTSNDIMQAADARPVDLAVNQLYEGLERGTVDGFTQLPFSVVATAGLAEVTPYLTDIGSGAYSSAAFAMNKDIWDGLPKEVQEVFRDVSEDFVSEYFKIYQQYDKQACETYRTNDVTLSRLPENEITRLRDRAVGPQVTQWKKRATDAGVKAADVDDFFKSYQSRIAAAEPKSTDYQNPFEACSKT